jgi:hypothetical protein
MFCVGLFFRVGAMTCVIATSREEVPGKGRDYDTGNGSLCLENRNDIFNSLFENIPRCCNNFTTEVKSSIAPEGHGSGNIELFVSDRAIS